MGKRMWIFAVVLIAAGCVKTEVLNKPDKIKTITVWDSDLKLHYDRLTDDTNNRRKEEGLAEPPVYEEKAEEALTEGMKERGALKIAELSWDEVEERISRDIKKKQIIDERESKRIEEIGEVSKEESEKERVPARVKWIIVLAAFASFGGYFTSVKKSKE